MQFPSNFVSSEFSSWHTCKIVQLYSTCKKLLPFIYFCSETFLLNKQYAQYNVLFNLDWPFLWIKHDCACCLSITTLITFSHHNYRRIHWFYFLFQSTRDPKNAQKIVAFVIGIHSLYFLVFCCRRPSLTVHHFSNNSTDSRSPGTLQYHGIPDSALE